jgi:hypothetical protein
MQPEAQSAQQIFLVTKSKEGPRKTIIRGRGEGDLYKKSTNVGHLTRRFRDPVKEGNIGGSTVHGDDDTSEGDATMGKAAGMAAANQYIHP